VLFCAAEDRSLWLIVLVVTCEAAMAGYRLGVFLLLTCILCAGCRRDPHLDVYIETLNAEKRILEDELYRLQYEMKIREERIERLESGSEPKKPSPGALPQPGARPNSPFKPENGSPSEPMLEGPKIESGEPAGPDILGRYEELPPPPRRRPVSKPEPPPTDRKVTHLVVNKRLSGGHDFDASPGDDGLALVVEPRNADDRFVPTAGEVSVVVLDPGEEGEAARIARWDLSAEEVKRRMHSDDFYGRGIHLKLPWPDQPPAHSDLAVFVRFVNDEGKKIETRLDLNVALQGNSSVRWTPRPGMNEVQLPPTSDLSDAPQRAGFSRPSVRTASLPGAAPSAAPKEQLLAPPPGLSQPELKEAVAPAWSPFRD